MATRDYYRLDVIVRSRLWLLMMVDLGVRAKSSSLAVARTVDDG